jgi:hypothetical protein
VSKVKNRAFGQTPARKQGYIKPRTPTRYNVLLRFLKHRDKAQIDKDCQSTPLLRSIQALQNAITDGIESGDAGALDMSAVKKKARKKAGL